MERGQSDIASAAVGVEAEVAATTVVGFDRKDARRNNPLPMDWMTRKTLALESGEHRVSTVNCSSADVSRDVESSRLVAEYEMVLVRVDGVDTDYSS
jgi:hypothetical protein